MRDEKLPSGHRQRLRERFLAGEECSRTDGALLELLLSYAIPQKDVQPLARTLLAEYGSLANVLAAPPESLCQVGGIKLHSAVLLKLTHWIATQHEHERRRASLASLVSPDADVPQPDLLTPYGAELKKTTITDQGKQSTRPARKVRSGTGMFARALLGKAVELLPQIPPSYTLTDIVQFVQANLPYSAGQTRERYAQYIVHHLFPDGYPDDALRQFAKRFVGRQELRDICYYRLCKAAPVMYRISEDLLMPALGHGHLKRVRLRDYLSECFPTIRSIGDYSNAIVDAIAEGGIATADSAKIVLSYRDVLPAAFTFVIHSEFPEPGIYDIAKLENNQAVRSMLWNPDRILPALYELRNRGLISKVSEIDDVRQFTTKWTLDEAVEALIREFEKR